MRALRSFAVLAGLAVAGWLVWQVGPATLAGDLRALSWRLAVLMLPQAAVSVVLAVAWKYAFPRRRPALGPLINIRLAGEAVNDTTPTGTLGGDALKALLVTRAVPGVVVEEGLVSVVVAKTALVGAQATFLLSALGVAWLALAAPPAVLALLGFLAAFTTAATVVFVGAQLRGLFRMGGRVLAWAGIGERAASVAARLDRMLRAFYRDSRDRLAATWALHLTGWVVGVAETWLALRFLGTPVPLGTALVIEAGAVGARAAGFLVPASIGIQEGGVVGLCVLLGLGSATGLAFGIVRRIREVAYIVLGYACLALGPGLRVAAPGPGS